MRIGSLFSVGVSDWVDRWPAGPDETPHAWEPPAVVARGVVAHDRARRLRGLGNAVVPACAEFVGRVALDMLARSTP